MMRTHVDLFTGIGGFTLAANRCGVPTIAMCEIDPRCRTFLAKAWPSIPIYDDVRIFQWRESNPWLLTAGVPCQPASRAGKQRGAADDRWLWPDTLRILGDLLPTWALFENPPGIGDVGLAGILSAMAAQGYQVRVFDIPACAVGAPHRRARYWIVAHHECARLEESTGITKDNETKCTTTERSFVDNSLWSTSVWLPCADRKIRRAPSDAVSLVDGLHRSILTALGNSIVWPVAARIIAAMIEAEEA